MLFFAGFLLVQPVFSQNYKEFTNNKFIDENSIHISNISGSYIPYEYLYIILYSNDGSPFFKDLEEKVNKKIGQVMEAKAINCRDKKIMMLTMDIFDDSLKSMAYFINYPYSSARFKDIDSYSEPEYLEVCQSANNIPLKNANKKAKKNK